METGDPACRGFSLAWLLAFMKSFASLVSSIVGLFYMCWESIKQTNYGTDKQHNNNFVNTKSCAGNKPLLAE